MELTGLLQLVSEMPAYRRLAADLRQRKDSIGVVLDAAKPYLVAALYRELGLPVLVITAQPENGRRLQEQISAWCGSDRVRIFPEPDALPYQRVVSDASTELERIQVLSAFTVNRLNGEMPLIVVSASALMQKVAPFSDFTSAWHTVRLGMDVEPRQLLQQWQAIGYRREDIVEVQGTMSQRGGILDIYPPTSELPVRLEFLGNTIDSLRLFDPESQRSLEALSEVDIGPATELIMPLSGSRAEPEMLIERQIPADRQLYAPLFNNGCILDYLPEGALLIIDEPDGIRNAVEALDAEASQLFSDKLERGELPRNYPVPYFTWGELEPRIANRFSIALTSWEPAGKEEIYKLKFTPAPGCAGQLTLFIKKAKQLLGQRHRLILVSHQASRLSELLAEEDVIASPVTEVKQIPPPGSLTLVQGLLAGGWTMNGDSHLLTDAEIFGFIKQQRLLKKRLAPRHKLFVDITPGDYVVHIEHGIARFAGVTMMSSDHIESEYLVLEYAGDDRLYVPTDQIDRVSRYIGASDRTPALNRLGTPGWWRTRQKVRESVESVARELLGLYAAREVVPGFAFSPDTVWQQELEASFPYVETPDQIAVQEEVKNDMSKAKPMDRLILGDVGYGKTEVAIRAAFKVVMDNKQVAVLVPTTVLAQQHYTTFSQRLGAFPVRVEVLSRFRSPKEQQAVLEGLASGTVDICIGTHRLLQKDVVFKDLGLLIIDEEQRFGVSHKEYLKKMRQDVDVLTLSATPIPRTLHMSLVGVRDMSTIETPPGERLPIRTYVAEYDDRLVREAILREIERNGQVFFVHNRVQSINFVADKVQALVPEARLAVAHGRMAEGELEAVMTDFTRGEIDVLVCTTIIESGLDVPNANTLIVNQADRFGLTQLYQLRGRVGRGANLAYAYFLYDKGKRLTPDAEKRLRTIYEATELGAGFGIAIKDMEIRGAGNLLGVRQSGHINAVGFSLYTRLLAEAVEELKAGKAGRPVEKAKRLPSPTIDLPLPAYIPEEYVYDINTRLGLYQRLTGISSAGQIEDMSQELADRFGALPREVKNLLYAVRVKLLAARAGIESIATEEGQIVLRLFEGMQFDRQKLEPDLRDGIKFGLKQIRIDFKRLGKEWQRVLEDILKRVG